MTLTQESAARTVTTRDWKLRYYEAGPADAHPLILLHDPSVPRNEALLLDLREAEVRIEGAVSPAKLPLDVVEYLAPRGRVDYYIDGGR